MKAGLDPAAAESLTTTAYLYDDDGNVEEELPVDFAAYTKAAALEEPDPTEYGVWVPGLPVLIGAGLDAVNCADWLRGLILDGIVGGVGAVLGFNEPIPNRCQPSPNTPSFAQSVAQVPTVVTDTK